ncbi:toll/interleukin-1 receptor domain-containing protein [Shewanella sp. NKUCC06_TVS]|uniref:toll/interleukin-1 receptor domain-containing protein n=1 Tax=Shewanella sp. NKUCC06_TVS TaxID=2842128 RepID=UPI001C5AE2A1|nr:toll/interleukin-1 receptor domain-containing protein [Shewanella sp. NKUCC06_TVS]MBW3532233.1 toll/interleukin-1 receptor domain-containing protein [Shewanella sp. NKUCC06_TVS]
MQVFISYSWDNEEHKTWVRQFADKLIHAGIPVILDQYDLRGGSDMHHFMENAVSSSSHILVICTPQYVSRANERIKGAGEETSLITGEFYNRHVNGKTYFPIVRTQSTKPVPDYLGSLVYFDFSNDQNFESTFEDLLRNIYQEPRYVKPDLGSKPLFFNQPPQIPTNVLSLESLKNRVLSSEPEDWVYDDDIGVYSNKHDIRLQIRNRRTDRYESFREEWTDRFPDPSASRDFYDIYYDNNRVCDYFQVSVDGGRVSIPIPKLGNNLSIDKEQYTFGRLIHYSGNNCLYDFEDYLRRAGISVTQ